VRIAELFERAEPVFSFEFFPPKTARGVENLYQTIGQLRELEPSFVSVTYGAGGTTRDLTVDLVTRIRSEIGIEAMAHLTCVGAGRTELAAVLDELRGRGIENVLALRGDPPRDRDSFEPVADGFAHAAELVGFIRAREYPLCVGGAGYPEGHVECRDLAMDMRHLVAKVDAGLEFIITQLFFDNRDFFAFVERARAAGIRTPIVPGIMPITNLVQIERFTRMCGAAIPPELMDRLERSRDDEAAVREIGIEHAAAQCRGLLAGGAPGIHFYTLNQSPATRAILRRIRG
jgi:methylenetetrahydrofolate reductase (NADPH)